MENRLKCGLGFMALSMVIIGSGSSCLPKELFSYKNTRPVENEINRQSSYNLLTLDNKLYKTEPRGL